MLLIFGDKYDFEYLGTVDVPCPDCHRSPCGLHLARKKLTVYFIPTVNLSSSYVLRCRNCGRQWEIDHGRGEQLRLQIRSGPPPPGGRQAAGPAPAPTAQGAGPCPQCGYLIQGGMRYCQNCGHAVSAGLAVVTCRSCGVQQHQGRFCTYCGAPLAP